MVSANLLKRPLASMTMAALLAAVSLATSAQTGTPPSAAAPAAPAPAELLPRHRDFLATVEVLITPPEREIFLALRQPHQRDAFIRRFWKVRDPYPRTEQNELQVRWEERSRLALAEFGDFSTEKAKLMVYFGAPTRRFPMTCTALRDTLDLWFFDDGHESYPHPFAFVFVGRHAMGQRFRPNAGMLGTLLAPGVGVGFGDARAQALIAEDCSRADDLFGALAQTLDVDRLLEGGLYPKPDSEWAQAFAARTTDLPAGADALDSQLELRYPGRNQSRTVVQALLSVPKAELTATQVGPASVYNLLIDGEVLRQGELFESFRYRFDFPEAAVGDELPLVFQRSLRPGPYTVVVRVQDANAGRFGRHQLEVEVPAVAAKIAAAAPAPPAVGEAPVASVPVDSAQAAEVDRQARAQVIDAALFEANASLVAGDQAIKILPPPAGLQIGRLRVEARARGEGISRVAFELNGRPVMKKSAPPYSVELDLGTKPRLHVVKVSALGQGGQVVASDELVINAGPHRFAIRLIEPQTGKIYEQSLRAAAEVELPEGETLDRVELFLDETRVATLYQPPFEQPILLPPSGKVSYVRAVAYLADGNMAEDLRFVNAPEFVDQVKVNFVELYASVVDRSGDFVEGLQSSDFTVLEDGKPQQLRRFETVRDQPIRAGLVLDTSLSMQGKLEDVEKAAYRFLETVLQPRDRAAVITFNDQPRLAVKFTNDRAVLAGGLAGLVAEGETALYDTLLYGMHYFSGITGKRTLIVLTDGEDSKSTYLYDDVMEFARHSGIAIYMIGLGLTSNKQDVRSKITRLANETGGAAFFIDNANQLGRIYERIQLELRSQYLLAYQSSQPADQTGFREIDIKVPKGLEANSIKGYYP